MLARSKTNVTRAANLIVTFVLLLSNKDIQRTLAIGCDVCDLSGTSVEGMNITIGFAVLLTFIWFLSKVSIHMTPVFGGVSKSMHFCRLLIGQ